LKAGKISIEQYLFVGAISTGENNDAEQGRMIPHSFERIRWQMQKNTFLP